MPIVYGAVASDRDIVANFASCDGNFTEIAEQVLSKLPPCNNKMTYSHGTYLLHYIAEGDHLFFCITDKLCQRSRAFLFLNEIQRRFIANQSKEDFTTVLAAEMYRYSEDYSTIVIRKGELDELNSISVGCSESILGEKILYINNPDNISYSTISHVSATPRRVTVSVVSPNSDQKSANRISPERTSVSVASPTSERIMDVSSTAESVSADASTLEGILGSPERKSSSSPDSLNLSDVSSILGKLSATSPGSERISPMDPKPVVSPRLLVVIIGMVILIIGMAVYAFGPVSCVFVTSIGIYSLLRFYEDSKAKSE